MPLALLAMAFQLRTAALGGPEAVRATPSAVVDSVRDARRARDAQASFERVRRYNLPWEGSSGDRCQVRLGRYCWWYDETTPTLPPENATIAARRAELIAQLDGLAALHPGDDWLAGMRVHYRVDAQRLASADSVARDCKATRWWCDALLGYAAHVRGDPGLADSAFAAALAAMSDSTRCRWTDIHTLLPNDWRGRYEELSCADRAPLERRREMRPRCTQ